MGQFGRVFHMCLPILVWLMEGLPFVYRGIIDDRAINCPYTVIVDMEIFIDRCPALSMVIIHGIIIDGIP